MFDPDTIDKSKFSNTAYVKKVEKPWGYELHWVSEDFPYMGKILHLNSGKRISLQIHDQKQESWLLASGEAKIIWDNEKGELIETVMKKGVGYSCHIGQRHRQACRNYGL